MQLQQNPHLYGSSDQVEPGKRTGLECIIDYGGIGVTLDHNVRGLMQGNSSSAIAKNWNHDQVTIRII